MPYAKDEWEDNVPCEVCAAPRYITELESLLESAKDALSYSIDKRTELEAENQQLRDELGTLKAWMKRTTYYYAGVNHQYVWDVICREYPYLAGNVVD